MTGEGSPATRASVRGPAPVGVAPADARRSDAAAALEFARRNHRRAVATLQQLVRVPTISADPRRRSALEQCAQLLAGKLEAAGIPSQILSTPGAPVVYGARRTPRPAPTVLLYGHYDVQPPDDGDTRPSFEARIEDGYLFGRGASDDKGQLLCHLSAIESWVRAVGDLPVNLKVLLEGEEEIGSPHLPELIRRKLAELAANVVVISDGTMPTPDQPAITYALRGAVGLDVAVRRAGPALHSGVFGDAVVDPLQVLAKLLAGLVDERGRIVAPAFYAGYHSIAAKERAYLRRTGPDDARLLAAAGAPEAGALDGRDLYLRATSHPSLTVTTIRGGYQGPGPKAVLAAEGQARLDIRIVPAQRPHAVAHAVCAHLKAAAPRNVRVATAVRQTIAPFEIHPGHPAVAAARRALARGFGRPPILSRSGGTIPAARLLADALNAPVLLLGFGLPTDRIHGPDERFALTQLKRGTEAAIALYEELGQAPDLQRRRTS